MEVPDGRGKTMQITLRIALAAAAFALGSVQALAFDMPPDGTKNFNAPSYAPSYFTDETVPESARVNHEATFESQEVLEPAVSEERWAAPAVRHAGRYGRHAYGSVRHAYSRYSWHSGATHSVGRASTSRNYTTRHTRSGLRQHAVATLPATA